MLGETRERIAQGLLPGVALEDTEANKLQSEMTPPVKNLSLAENSRYGEGEGLEGGGGDTSGGKWDEWERFHVFPRSSLA